MTGDFALDSPKTAHRPLEAELSAHIWNSGIMSGDLKNASNQAEIKAGANAVLGPVTITDNSKNAVLPDNIRSGEANSLLLQAADQTVNQSIYRLPRWSHLSKPVPGLGCVSSFSNRYRAALNMAGFIDSPDDKKYRDIYSVNMDDLNKVMGSQRLLDRIKSSDVKEGDVIEGVNPDSSKRHIGIVGRIENGTRMVYDNFAGTWRKESLSDRFGQYEENNYYRAFLPPRK